MMFRHVCAVHQLIEDKPGEYRLGLRVLIPCNDLETAKQMRRTFEIDWFNRYKAEVCFVFETNNGRVVLNEATVNDMLKTVYASIEPKPVQTSVTRKLSIQEMVERNKLQNGTRENPVTFKTAHNDNETQDDI
jgi:hypothetical protein